MRTLMVLLLLAAGGFAGAWLGGESWLAREAARRIDQDPNIAAASVSPLREINRIGLHLTGLEVGTPEGPATLPALDLWAAPTAPTEFHASLPPAMTVPVAGRERHLAATDAVLTLRLSPGSGMAVGRAAAQSGTVTLDGAPVMAALDVEARLAALGAGAPRSARASYRIEGRAEGVIPATFAPLPPALTEAGALSAEGRAHLYLTGAVQPGAAEPPRLVGLSSDGVTLQLGARTARVAGSVQADAQGRAEGAVFVYAADPRGWLDLAAAAGMIPDRAVALAGTALGAAASMTLDLPPGTPAPPPPAEGELRLPLIFRDGQSFLGPLPLGPAPTLPVLR